MSREWTLGDVHDVVSSEIPDRVMIVHRDDRRTYREVRERAEALASFLTARGFGAFRERGDLARWEAGQDRVAILAYNIPEHVETLLGCWRARVVPCNVNYHYTAGEVADLLHRIGARGAVYDRRLAGKLSGIVDDLDLLVELGSEPGAPSLPHALHYERALAEGAASPVTMETSPDDLYMACTGGTTGRPKAVMWRQGDIFVAGMGGADGIDEAALRARASAGAGTWFPTSPLMHVAAQWTALLAANMGATVVLHDDARPFDVRTILETAARERANMMTIVGDAYARPMIEELRSRPYDLAGLAVLGTGGTPTSVEAKRALMELLPHVTIRDGYGGSEIGVMASGETVDDASAPQSFTPVASARLLAGDRTRFLDVGDDEVGWIVRTGHVPLGYLDDEAATESTFPVVEGQRVAIAGDRARYTPDGHVVLLGRDSLVVNTGGEKVFVEEVEDALKRHGDVVDALVVGRPSERFGQEVTAIVQLRPECAPRPDDLREWCTTRLARYKAPRAFVFVERVQRHPSGKANYQWARETSAQAIEVS
jgi:3-oxocholest-4-en-26-oate---CoA ligase